MQLLTPAIEKAYIDKLLVDDIRVSGQANTYYQDALKDILAHLNYYIRRFGIDGVLKYVALLKHTDWQDNDEIERADRSARLASSSDQQVKQREKLLTAQAKIGRFQALNALIGWSIAGASLSTIELLKKTLTNDFETVVSRQFNASQLALKSGAETMLTNGLTKHKILRQSKKIVSTTVTGEDWSNNIWLYNDSLVNNVQNIVTKSLRSGLKQSDLNKLFPNIKQMSGGSITEQFELNNAYIKRIIITERARVLDQATTAVFKAKGIKYFDWVTQAGACGACVDIESGNPYLVDDPDSPSIPNDSHPNCRCTKIAHIGN